MKTVVAAPTPEAIVRAAEIIRHGGLVAFPTETVYGLGANALDARAVAKIYEAKQRALNDPLIVHVALPCHSESRSDEESLRNSTDQSARYFVKILHSAQNGGLTHIVSEGIVGDLTSEQSDIASALIARFWPGPLTLVLPRGERIPPIVSAGLDTVAVRMPDHPIAQALIRESGVPIAAPSANRFGHVSPTTAQHVLDDLDGRIDVVLNGGPTRIGVESTVLDLTGDPSRILRPGGITWEQLQEVLKIGDWQLAIGNQSEIQNRKSKIMSPGMLDKHYAPKAKLILCRDTDDMLIQNSKLKTQNLNPGLLILDNQRAACENLHPQFVLGRDVNDMARNLYAGLRTLDSAGVDVILMTEVERRGLGEAIADRLKRAAAK